MAGGSVVVGPVQAILIDSDGNQADIVTVSGVNRLAVDATLVDNGDDNPIHVIVDSSFPLDPTKILRKFVKNGSSDDLRVDGDPTPVVFTYPADLTKDIRIYEIRFIFSANSTPFGANKFGPQGGGLPNGLQCIIYKDAVETELANIKVNEDFLALTPSADTIVDQTGAADVIAAGIAIGSTFRLRAGTSDEIRVKVRDDIAGMAGMQYLKCVVFGVKD